MGNAELTASQRAAIAHIRARVSQAQGAARARVLQSLRRAEIDAAAFDASVVCIREQGRWQHAWRTGTGCSMQPRSAQPKRASIATLTCGATWEVTLKCSST